MAQMFASIDVGWNGTTAEVTAEASIKSYDLDPITYGFNLRYSVVRLTPNGQWAANLWNQPGLLLEQGVLQAEEGSFDDADYTPDSNSFDGKAARLRKGTYLVQGRVTVTAQPPEDGKIIDELNVSDTEKLYISDPE